MRTIVHFIDSTTFGGAEQMALRLMEGLNRHQWRPILVYHPHPGNHELVVRARALDVSLHPIPQMSEGFRGAARVPSVARAFRKLAPAVFHAHLTWPVSCKFGLAAAVLARVPAIVATQHLHVNIPWGHSRRLQYQLLTLGVDQYIAVSREVAGQLETLPGMKRKTIKVIHNGVDMQRFAIPVNERLRRELMGSWKRPIVLTTARLEKQKGLYTLIQAAALVPNAVFVLAGEGSERAHLESLARDRGLTQRVQFLGHRDDVAELLSCCDIYALPSLFEGLPVGVLEAMAAAKPVVTSVIGGTTEVAVHGQTGLLVAVADPPALAAAIQIFLDNPELAIQFGSAGRVRVGEEFSASVMVDRVTQVYTEILNQNDKVRGRHKPAI